MRYAFDIFELDTDQHELRRNGLVQPLQPKAHALLAYLIEHRSRVVSKSELLERLWPDVIVTDASVQRAVSQVRATLGDDGRFIRTVARHGYRFIATTQTGGTRSAAPALEFHPRFVRSGDAHIAYQTVGQGEVDIVVVPGWVFPMKALFDLPQAVSWLRQLAELGRVVLFDKRGTGMSDRVKTLPTLEERADDLRTVLDAVDSREAILVGMSEGGPLSILCAASFAHRVRGLLLAGAFARWSEAPGFPHGWPRSRFDELRRYIADAWGTGLTVRAIVAGRDDDTELAAWAARAERDGASPGAALDLLAMNVEIDVRGILPAVTVPTLVLHHAGDPVIDVTNGRYLAAHIPGARLVETNSADHAFLLEGVEQLREAVRWLLQQSRPPPAGFLATLVTVDHEEGAGPLPLEGVAARYGGLAAGTHAWTFDGPQRAIQCAHALAGLAGSGGVRLRVGVHAGEVRRTRDGTAGEGIDTARAIARRAPQGEIRVSQVVRDLVHGAAFAFDAPESFAPAEGRTIDTYSVRPLTKVSER